MADMEEVQGEVLAHDGRHAGTKFLKDYPLTDALLQLRELVTYIHSHWKAVKKCPPDMRKTIKRTSQVLKSELPPDHYHHERRRKFMTVENSGQYSVPWEPYAELGTVELNTTNLILNNLVPTFAIEESPSVKNVSPKPTSKIRRDLAKIPTVIYPFPKDQFGELTAYNLIKRSLDFITQISEDLKNPKRNLQEVYRRKKKEFNSSKRERGKGMVFIPFKAVDRTAAQEIVEAVVEKFSSKLRAILDIIHTLLNFENGDVQNKLPLSHLAMVRLKRSKYIDMKKTSEEARMTDTEFLNQFSEEEKRSVKDFFGRPEPIWQNKYKVTGVPQFSSKVVRYGPDEVINQLRGILFRATDRIRSAGIYMLKRLETDFERRYKYTSLALSALPLILIQVSEIPFYAELLRDVVDRAAYVNGNTEILKGDKDLSLYLLGELDEVLGDLLEMITQDEVSLQMPKAVWYQMLENEADECGVLNEEIIQTLLKQIYELHTLNLSKVKYIHEKFCMLVMSAPMEEVCDKSWQTAAKFLHEHIMEGAEGMIEYWLAERGIPLLIRKVRIDNQIQ